MASRRELVGMSTSHPSDLPDTEWSPRPSVGIACLHPSEGRYRLLLVDTLCLPFAYATSIDVQDTVSAQRAPGRTRVLSSMPWANLGRMKPRAARSWPSSVTRTAADWGLALAGAHPGTQLS